MSAANRIQIDSRWRVRHSSGWTGASTGVCDSPLSRLWLVGGLEHLYTFVYIFHILGMSSSQLTNSIIFQRDRSTTNQLESCRFHGQNKVVLPPQLHRKMVLAAGLNSHWLHQVAQRPGVQAPSGPFWLRRRYWGHFYTAEPPCWLLPFAATPFAATPKVGHACWFHLVSNMCGFAPHRMG